MSSTRPPVFAGRFYPASADACQQLATEYFQQPVTAAATGAIVPHAGWIYSGSTAALSITAIANTQPEVVVLFGAPHGPDPNAASVYARGTWDTPLGPLRIDQKLADRFLQHAPLDASTTPHLHEHSIEVQLPLLKHRLPDVKIVPILVRPGPVAAEVGRHCGEEAREYEHRVAFLGSTDLTHYGPAFGFEPHGRGLAGLRWAKDVNDRRLIGLIEALDADGVLRDAGQHHSACGSGAIAATIGAMRALGSTQYLELRHTTSTEAEAAGEPDPFNAVGYEAGVFLNPQA